MWSYWLKWNETDTKKRHLGFPTHINFDDYQTLKYDYKVNLGKNNIEPIGKRAIKIDTKLNTDALTLSKNFNISEIAF